MTPSLSDQLYRQDHRVQATRDRYAANTGSGFSVSRRKRQIGRAIVDLLAVVFGLSGFLIVASAVMQR